MSRSERIRIKGLICILGGVLLALLLGGHVLLRMLKPGEAPEPEPEPEPEPHIPVIEELHNVWIMEAGENSLLLFRDGVEEHYPYGDIEVEIEEEVRQPDDAEQGKKGRKKPALRDIVPENAPGADGSDGAEKTVRTQLQMYQPPQDIREQIADVLLTDGAVTDVRVKGEKINGVILSADAESIEVEGYGRLPLADDCKGYRVYDTLVMCNQRDLAFGYDFTDLVLDNGKVCGILMAREEAMQDVRVLIKGSDYAGVLHQEVKLTADTDFVIRYGEYDNRAEEIHAAGDEVVITGDSAYFMGGRITVAPSVITGRILLKNVGRSQKKPSYHGYLEMIPREDGFAIVNVVSLEEYLYAVVPSEMPSTYPKEALKAQAICARTYAYGHMRHAGYPSYGAHMDDSASYQVYNNISEQESTTTAVKETYGRLLYTEDGRLAETYYYSTSCGAGSDANVWKTEAAGEITYLRGRAINPSALRETQDIGIGEYLRDEEHFAAFIKGVDPEDFESGEGWYRWSYQVKKLDPGHMCEVLKKRYQARNDQVLTLAEEEYVSREVEDFSEVRDLYVASRGEGGVADELVLETDSGTYKVITEHNIRFVLCDGETKVKLQNGSKVNTPTMLPSGFFIIETGKEDGNVVKYTLTGGGFGHGVGMSQNAAKSMAASGFSCTDILLFFYEGCELQAIY